MANEPFGDVEIVSPPPVESHTGGRAPDGPQRYRTTRLRLLRASRAVEVSRYSPRGDGKTAGEWTKRVFPILGQGFDVKIPSEELDGLDDAVTGALEMLGSFLKLCKLVETCESDSAEPSITSATHLRSEPWSGTSRSRGSATPTPTSCIINPLAQHTYSRPRTLADKTNTTVAATGCPSVDLSTATAAATSTVASMRIPPRPRKLNLRHTSRSSAMSLDSKLSLAAPSGRPSGM